MSPSTSAPEIPIIEPTEARPNPAQVKVICLGLGRTGVSLTVYLRLTKSCNLYQDRKPQGSLDGAWIWTGLPYVRSSQQRGKGFPSLVPNWRWYVIHQIWHGKKGLSNQNPPSFTGGSTPADLDDILRGYTSVLDTPPIMYPEELYAAYPNAKYILVSIEELAIKTDVEQFFEIQDYA